LWATAAALNYRSGIWATYAQWTELGAQIRKGEKASLVVFWKFRDQDTETPKSSGWGFEAHFEAHFNVALAEREQFARELFHFCTGRQCTRRQLIAKQGVDLGRRCCL